MQSKFSNELLSSVDQLIATHANKDPKLLEDLCALRAQIQTSSNHPTLLGLAGAALRLATLVKVLKDLGLLPELNE